MEKGNLISFLYKKGDLYTSRKALITEVKNDRVVGFCPVDADYEFRTFSKQNMEAVIDLMTGPPKDWLPLRDKLVAEMGRKGYFLV